MYLLWYFVGYVIYVNENKLKFQQVLHWHCPVHVSIFQVKGKSGVVMDTNVMHSRLLVRLFERSEKLPMKFELPLNHFQILFCTKSL